MLAGGRKGEGRMRKLVLNFIFLHPFSCDRYTRAKHINHNRIKAIEKKKKKKEYLPKPAHCS